MSNSISDKIENVNNWLIMTSPAVPYILAYGLRQWTSGIYKRYPEYMLISIAGSCYFDKGSEMHYLADKEEYHRSFKKILNNLSILEKVYADFLIDEENFKRFISGIENKGDSFLNENFNKLIELYDAEYISGGIIDGILVYGDEFFEDMKKKYPNNEKEITHLTKAYGQSFLSRYQKDLLTLTLGNNDSIKTAQELQEKYYWIKNNYKNVKPLSKEFFVEQLEEIAAQGTEKNKAELELLNSAVENHRNECERIKSSEIFDSNDFEKMLWLGKIAWWVDRRKEYNLIANHFIGKHLEYLCEENNLDYEDASFLLPWELDDVINNKKNLSDFPIKERQKFSLYFYDIEDQEIFLVGEEAKNLWQKISPEAEKAVDEIKGMVANPGIAEGTARVILDPHNIKEFNEGDILVTGMTRPDFMVLMRKAVAFVTDEGGITCHAAIVSRELNKPCITGTKIATKVIKDGDTIEVDANEGIVKLLGTK